MGALTSAAALALFAVQADPSIAVSQQVAPVPAAPAPAPVPAQDGPVPVTAPPVTPPAAEPQQAQPEQQAPAAHDSGASIVVTAKPKNDPLLGVNAAAFNLTQDIDDHLVGPLADAYQKALPKPARIGLHNFIRNLSAPVVFINDLLQLKPGRAFKTLGRFVINTTVGVGGLMDVAQNKPFYLPYRHNGFANTLGYYGVKPGPYLFLPLIGPTTLRDVLGGAVDGVILPYGIGAPFNKLYYTLPNGVVRSLDRRVEFDCQLDRIRKSDDPYAAARVYYLKKRQAEIDELHGKGNGPETAAQCEAEAAGKVEAAIHAAPPQPVGTTALPPPASPQPAPPATETAPQPAPVTPDPSSASGS
ncbi:MAG: VacJ family lipoprotein [Novosphingobium sp.]